MNSRLLSEKMRPFFNKPGIIPSKTEPELIGYRDLLPSEYSYDQQHAVKIFYGYVEFDELAEALMVTAWSLQNAARAFGLLSEAHDHVTAEEIERAMNLIRKGQNANKVASLYGMEYNPDRTFYETNLNSTMQEELF